MQYVFELDYIQYNYIGTYVYVIVIEVSSHVHP